MRGTQPASSRKQGTLHTALNSTHYVQLNVMAMCMCGVAYAYGRKYPPSQSTWSPFTKLLVNSPPLCSLPNLRAAAKKEKPAKAAKPAKAPKAKAAPKPKADKPKKAAGKCGVPSILVQGHFLASTHTHRL